MINSSPIRIGALCFLLILAATLGFGQAVTGTIYGVVTDATGAVVSGAMVQVQNADTGFSRTEQTDAQGRYLSQNLPLGSYSVTVQQPGFRTEERRGITLSIGSEVALNVQLAVGNTQEKVEVVAEAPAIETSNATVSQLTTGEQVRDLPLNGRSMEQLAQLTPGLYVDHQINSNAAIGFGARMTINGGRITSILYLLDGTVINDPDGGAPVSAAKNILGVEGILEFRLLTHNFSSEYGRVSGAVFSMVTRSGTNQFHGSAYEFLRNDVFDARNFFNPGGLPPYRRNQFGGSIGGPVLKDRLFFFFNYEGERQLQGTTVNQPVPDANARLGLIPNAAGQLVPTTLNPAILPFLALYPLANGAELGGGAAQYLTTFDGISNEDYYLARMDYKISDKDNFYGRYVYNPSYRQLPRPIPTWGEDDYSNPHFVLMSETHVFSAASLNEVRIAYNRVNQAALGANFSIVPNVTFVPGQPFGEFTFAAGNAATGQIAAIGQDISRPETYPANTYQETETFSTVKGAHSLKFGVDVQRIELNLSQTSGNLRGDAVFGGLAGLLAATPTSVSLALPNPNNHFERGDRRTIIGLFAQDDFRIRPNLTLNIGLREDLFTSPTEVNGFMGALLTQTSPAITPGPSFISPWKAFSPRAGVAWDPFGDGKTSIRAGFGVYYNPVDGRDYYQQSFGGNIWLQTVKITNPPFPNVLGGSVTAPLPAINVMQYHLNNPTAYNYNFEIQRQLRNDLTLRVAYVGSKSYHLIRTSVWDTRVPTTINGVLTYPTTGALINPNFASVFLSSTDGRANYNALQSTITKRLAYGLMLTAAYTYSKAMSDSDEAIAQETQRTATSTMNPYNLGQDYSLSAYDERYHLAINGSYQLPIDKALPNGLVKKVLGGWAINGIYNYGSGLPVDILDGYNNSGNGDTDIPDRPNLNPGFSPNPITGTTAGCAGVAAGQALHTAALWFNPCAFSLSPAGTFGNLGRNTMEGPGTNEVDAALVKDTAINERIKVQFRWELFNLFNHPVFAIPNNNVFTSARTLNGSAGQITSTLIDNREMQFGLKVIF